MKLKTFIFVEYIFFPPDEGFYCWIAGGGVQSVWTNILIFKLIVLRLVTGFELSFQKWSTKSKWVVPTFREYGEAL